MVGKEEGRGLGRRRIVGVGDGPCLCSEFSLQEQQNHSSAAPCPFPSLARCFYSMSRHTKCPEQLTCTVDVPDASASAGRRDAQGGAGEKAPGVTTTAWASSSVSGTLACLPKGQGSVEDLSNNLKEERDVALTERDSADEEISPAWMITGSQKLGWLSPSDECQTPS